MQSFYDLFAGIGGFRLGLERAGFHCVGSCEIDKAARKIYKKNFGSEPEASNALKLDAGQMPDFDILAAGFPCQAFSFAGKRRGFEDTRGTLFFEIARIARQKRPQLLFLENVKGLLSHDGGRTFGTVINTLYELGYSVEWQIINGRYFLPQNRERVFIIGHLGEKACKQVFPLSEDGKALVGRKEKQGPTVAKTLTGGGHSGGLHSSMTVIASGKWTSRGFETKKDGTAHCLLASSSTGARTFAMLTETRSEHAKQIRREMQKQGKDWTARRDKELVPRTDNVANCITATQSREQMLSDGVQIRRLTPLECEKLQGFPPGWTKGVSDTARYRLLGNAVMPPVIEYIAKCF